MPRQTYKQPQQSKTATEETVDAQPAPVEQNTKLADDVEDMLDEIDSVLENNAEEFVMNYVQKGGE